MTNGKHGQRGEAWRRGLQRRLGPLRHPVLEIGEEAGELAGGGDSIAGVARQEARQQILERRRRRHPRRTQARGGLGEPTRDLRHGRQHGERRMPREHLVQNAPERVEVAPAVERHILVGLLGAHVRGRAGQSAGAGEAALGRRAHRAGHAEVGHDGVAFLEQDVLGLDVAMDHALPVCVVERIGHFARETKRPRRREAALAVEEVAERAVAHAGHDIIKEAAGIAGVVQRQQMGMLQPGHQPDLPQEPVGAELRGEGGLQHLERDDPVVAEVAGPVDHRHPAVPDLPLDRIAGFESGLEVVEQIEHGPTGKAVP